LESLLKADSADRLLALALEKVREDGAMNVEGHFNHKGVAEGYAKAFAEAGFDLVQGDARTLSERIAASPIKEQLVAALDDWSLLADPFPRKNAPWERLLEVARLAAPDPAWGDPVRQAATRRNKAACEELARKAAVAKLSPQMLHLVAYLLNDRQARLSWLRRAQAR